MAEGLITDCRLLLSRFENHKSVRFETFCEIWREMNFSLIHCGGRDTNRKIQMKLQRQHFLLSYFMILSLDRASVQTTTSSAATSDPGTASGSCGSCGSCEEAISAQGYLYQLVDYLFRIISTYLDPTPCSFPYRIGAVYALYAVYHTQLNRPKVRIRMTLSMMKDLKELHNQIVEQQHHDADYILRLMYKERAFLFVAMPIPLAYGSKEAITSQEEGQSSAFVDDVNDNLEERFKGVEKLDEAHKNYIQMKAKLLGSGAISADRPFSAISDNLVTDIASELQKFDEWKRTRCQKHVLERKTGTSLSLPNTGSVESVNNPNAPDKETNPAVTSTVEKESAAKGSRINEIKKRSFASVSKVSKSMRHLQPTKDSSDEENKSRKRGTKK